MWRSSTNDIPEAGLRPRRQKGPEQPVIRGVRQKGNAEANRWVGRRGQGVISRMADSTPGSSLPHNRRKHDKLLRNSNFWNIEKWKRDRTGGMVKINDKLNHKEARRVR